MVCRYIYAQFIRLMALAESLIWFGKEKCRPAADFYVRPSYQCEKRHTKMQGKKPKVQGKTPKEHINEKRL